jgi:hypothetical protein
LTWSAPDKVCHRFEPESKVDEGDTLVMYVSDEEGRYKEIDVLNHIVKNNETLLKTFAILKLAEVVKVVKKSVVLMWVNEIDLMKEERKT